MRSSKLIATFLLCLAVAFAFGSCAQQKNEFDEGVPANSNTPTSISIKTPIATTATSLPITIHFDDGNVTLEECQVPLENYQKWEVAKRCFGVDISEWTAEDIQRFGTDFYPENPSENAVFEGIRLNVGDDLYEARQTGFHAESDEPLEFSLFRNDAALLTLFSGFTTYNPNISLLAVDGQIVWEFANPNHPTVILDGLDLRKEYDIEEVYVPYELSGKLLFAAKKKGRYIVFYGGQPIAPGYDEVEIAYCCGAEGSSIRRVGGTYWFWAMREDKAYLVMISENRK